MKNIREQIERIVDEVIIHYRHTKVTDPSVRASAVHTLVGMILAGGNLKKETGNVVDVESSDVEWSQFSADKEGFIAP